MDGARSVQLLTTVTDCTGRPFTGLTADDLRVREDGQALPATTGVIVEPRPAQTLLVSLLVDASDLAGANLTPALAAARSLVAELTMQRAVPALVAVNAFAGDEAIARLTDFTLDNAAASAAIDAVADAPLVDRGSTNLYGAMLLALDHLKTSQRAFEERQGGGTITRGVLVVFSGGRDTSGRESADEVGGQLCSVAATLENLCVRPGVAEMSVPSATGTCDTGAPCDANGACCPRGTTDCACDSTTTFCVCLPAGSYLCAGDAINTGASGTVCPFETDCTETTEAASCCCGTDACRERELAARCVTQTGVAIVAVDSPELQSAALERLATDGLVAAAEPASLEARSRELANTLADRLGGVYFVGYCSARRGRGQVAITVEPTFGTGDPSAAVSLSTELFGADCSSESLQGLCEGRGCAAPGCGACDERTTVCSAGGQCADACDLPPLRCAGQSFVNPGGYQQSCPDRPSGSWCEVAGTCVDLQTTAAHCGNCGNDCGTAICSDGECTCSVPGRPRCQTDQECSPRLCIQGVCAVDAAEGAPCTYQQDCAPRQVCDGAGGFGGQGGCRSVLVDLCEGNCSLTEIDMNNCGACGVQCGYGCVDGQCTCPSPAILCGTDCFDVQTDTAHCGGCDNACPAEASCVDGQCECPPALGDPRFGNRTACGPSCVDLQTDNGNCGGCGNVCPSGQWCSQGTCATPCEMGWNRCNGVCTMASTCDCSPPCGGGSGCTAGFCSNGRCQPGVCS